MVLVSISLTNFRNYSKASFTFSPRTTLIVGPNASGKTNILEAIYMLARGQSFRARYDREVIKSDENVAHLRAVLDQETSLDLAVLTSDRGDNLSAKRFKVNGVKKARAAFVGRLHAVVFSPEEIALVTGSPSRRRRYIDSVLTQVDKEYTRTLNEYEKVLRQRNRLLRLIREGEATRDQLDLWDEKLLQLGPNLTIKRQKFFETINNQLSAVSSAREGLFLDYQSKVLNPEVLSKDRDREIAAGKTFYGPHRDDFVFKVKDGRDLSIYGSRGEQRMAVLNLKLAELEFIKKQTNERPVLLLDDIFSELDQENRDRVLKLLDQQQTIITTTEDQKDQKDSPFRKRTVLSISSKPESSLSTKD